MAVTSCCVAGSRVVPEVVVAGVVVSLGFAASVPSALAAPDKAPVTPPETAPPTVLPATLLPVAEVVAEPAIAPPIFLAISSAEPPAAAVFTAEAPAETTAFVTAGFLMTLLISVATAFEPVFTIALTVAFLTASSKEAPCAVCKATEANAVPAAADIPNDAAKAEPIPGIIKDMAIEFMTPIPPLMLKSTLLYDALALSIAPLI